MTAATSFLSALFQYVLATSAKYEIDESHGISHSMNVLHFAKRLYGAEVVKYPFIKKHENIIYTSAILHDMCDKKYMDETEGVEHIKDYLRDWLSPTEIEISTKIMTTMSYSTVKRDGFPNLGEYQLAYNIVRESDLLTAYDFDRSMIYNLNKDKTTIEQAYQNAHTLFETRVFRHRKDGLFLLDSSKMEAIALHRMALKRMSDWSKLLF
jgi:HD superfamily phosphodiesterase